MQARRCGLTLAVTVPILGLIFFGLAEFVIGALIRFVFGVGMIGQAFSRGG